jgi:hypothetical protein
MIKRALRYFPGKPIVTKCTVIDAVEDAGLFLQHTIDEHLDKDCIQTLEHKVFCMREEQLDMWETIEGVEDNIKQLLDLVSSLQLQIDALSHLPQEIRK